MKILNFISSEHFKKKLKFDKINLFDQDKQATSIGSF